MLVQKPAVDRKVLYLIDTVSIYLNPILSTNLGSKRSTSQNK